MIELYILTFREEIKMITILNFLICIFLSLIDLSLIQYSLSSTENMNLKFNIQNIIILIVLTLYNFNIFTYLPVRAIIFMSIIVFYILLNKPEIKKEEIIRSLIIWFFNKIILYIFTVYLFTWFFDSSLAIAHTSSTIPQTLMLNIFTRYIEFLIFCYFLKSHTFKNFRLFKLLSIALLAYFTITFILSNKKLFYFPSVGRTFTFIVIVYTIAMIYFDRYQTKYQREVEELNRLNEQLKSDYNHLRVELAAEEEIRRIRHDVKNNIGIIASYIQLGEYDEAMKYTKSISNEIERATSHIHIGEHHIDSVINRKITAMKDYNIKFEKDFSSCHLGHIDVNKICLILSITLDNAIEACKDIEDAYIRLSIKCKKNYFIIKVENSIIPGTKIDFTKTSKKVDIHNHGFGMKKLQSIAKEYHGDVEACAYDNHVIVSIRLLIQDNL